MSDAPQGNSVLAFLASEFGAQELPTLSYLATMLTQEEAQEEETTKPTAVVHTEDAVVTTTTSTQEAETPEVAEQQQQCVDTLEDEAVERRSVPLIPGTSMLDFVIRNLCQDKHAFPCLHLLQEQLQHDEHDNNNKKEEAAPKKVNVPAESTSSHAVTLSTEADKDLTEDMIMIGEGATTALQQQESVKEEEKDNQQVVVAAMTSEVLTSPSSVQHTEPDKVEEEARRATQRKVSDIPVIVGVTESTEPHTTKRTAHQLVTEQKPKTSNNSKVEEEKNARWQAGRRPRRISETLLTQLRQQLHARRSSQPTAVAGSPHVIQHPQAEEVHKAEDASEVVARVRRGFVERYLDNLYGRKRSTPLAKPSPHSRRFPLHNNNSPVGSAKKSQEADGNAVVEEENEHQPLLPEPHSGRQVQNNAIGKHHNELEQRVTTPHMHQQQRLDTHALEEKANVLSSQITTPRQLAQRHVTSEFFQDYRVPLHTPRTPSQPPNRREPRRPSRLTGVHDVLATPNSQPYGSRRNSHSIRLHHDNSPPTGVAAANRMKSPIASVPVQRRRSSANGRQQGRPPSALRVQQQQQQQPLGVRNSLDLVVVGKTVKMAQSQPHRPSSALRR